jgi:hypothetical protein
MHRKVLGYAKANFESFNFRFMVEQCVYVIVTGRYAVSLRSDWFILFPLAMLDSVLNTKKMARGYIGLLSLHRKLRLPTKGVFSATRICKHIVLYYRLSIPSCNPHNTETQIGCDPQREILRMRANPACVSKSA